MTQTGVRPVQLGESAEPGRFLIIFAKIEDDLGKENVNSENGGENTSTDRKIDEIAKSRGRSATIAEEKNEIIEIPMRSYGRKISRGDRARTKDPRPENSAGEENRQSGGKRRQVCRSRREA